MIDVGGKPTTARVAVAEAIVTMAGGTRRAVMDGTLPKGDAGSVARVAVLVIGEMPDGGAICVDGPPEPVEIAGPAQAAAPPPECHFAAVLGEPVAQAAPAGRAEGDGAGTQTTVWWRFEPRRLFETLAGD